MIRASHAAFLAHVPCGLGVVFQHPARISAGMASPKRDISKRPGTRGVRTSLLRQPVSLLDRAEWRLENSARVPRKPHRLHHQVDNVGPYDALVGYYSPATYINISQTRVFPADSTIHVILVGGKIFCSVAVAFFLKYYWTNNVLHGVSVFNGRGFRTDHYACPVNNACTNKPGPFIVDANQVYTTDYNNSVSWGLSRSLCQEHTWCLAVPE